MLNIEIDYFELSVKSNIFHQKNVCKLARRKQNSSLMNFLNGLIVHLSSVKNSIVKATEYTLSRKEELTVFLENGNVAIDNNPAENAIRPNVIGRKNWLFSVSEASAKANAICLSLAKTAKANGIDFCQYLVKLLTELPNVPFHQQYDILHNYMPL